MRHEDYFDVTNVEGVTPEIIKEYKRLVRHERYVEEKDRKNQNYQYGDEKEIHYLLVRSVSSDISPMQEKLYDALEMLKQKNIRWHDAVVAYYRDSDNSYSIVAEELGISKQMAYLRVKSGIKFLKEVMLSQKKDDVG